MFIYKKAFLIALVLLTPLLLFKLPLYMIALWVTNYLLNKNKPYAFWLSLFLINLLWWPLLMRIIGRQMFIVEHQGMERADGYGSPLAFLIGMIYEFSVFLPLTIIFIIAITAIFTKRF